MYVSAEKWVNLCIMYVAIVLNVQTEKFLVLHEEDFN